MTRTHSPDPAIVAILRAFADSQLSAVRTLEPAWRSAVAGWIAYVLRHPRRYILSHAWDPPWDCSGRLEPTEEPFNYSLEATLADLDGEYTGNSSASHTSGCGIFHETLSDERFDRVREFARENILSALSASLRGESPLLDLSAYIDPDEPEDSRFKHAIQTLDEAHGEALADLEIHIAQHLDSVCTRWLLVDLLSEGRFVADRRRQKEVQAARVSSEAQTRQRNHGQRVLKDLIASYKRAHGPWAESLSFTKNDRRWPALRSLIEELSTEDQKALATVFLCSGWIRDWLSQGCPARR